MKKTLVLLLGILLASCGGSGGSGGSANPPPPPPATFQTQIAFSGLAGAAPADAALGQPLEVRWTLPTGAAIRSLALDAAVTAGPTGSQTTCNVSAGALAISATSALITIPNTCVAKTTKRVELVVTAVSTSGEASAASRVFAAPASPETFRPLRTSLPVLRITTDNQAPIVSKETYINGQMDLQPNVAGGVPVIGGLQIRGRGNSTWGMPKKPYRLKLTNRQSLLGMPSSRDWVLLANYSDKSLTRNALAMQLGANLGMPWAPRSAYVEVYLNDRYDGVYLLMENIKAAADRVNIDELDEDDTGAGVITGGYLLEVDFRQDGYTMFTAIDDLPIVFQSPEEPVQAQEDYIRGYIDQFEAVLHSADFANPTTGYAAYIDVDSFVRWYLVNEIFRNVDANMWTSCWMYKPRGGKLFMGPLWDFDLAAGNADYNHAGETAGWHIRTAPWFSQLFADPVFAARVRQQWNQIKTNQLPAMFASIDTLSAQLQQGQLNNFERWPILEMYVWPNNRVPGSYAGEIDYLESWLTARVAWMDSQLNP